MRENAESAGSDEDFSDAVLSRLRASLLSAVYDPDRAAVDFALSDMVGEARRRGLPPERMVVALKRLWHTTTPPGLMGTLDWDHVYRHALNAMLATYFAESGTA